MNAETTFPFARGTETGDNPLLLGISSSYLLEWNGSGFDLYHATEEGWKEMGVTIAGSGGPDFIEMQQPFESIGEFSAGDEIRLVAVVPGENLLPVEGPAQIILPDLGGGELVIEVQDPEGDDNNHTRILDLIWPEGASSSQAEMLGTYVPSGADPADLGADDFPQIELLIP